VNNDSSKQKQVGTKTLCFNGREFEQSSTHAQDTILLKDYNNKCLNLAHEQENAQTTSK
jgi:hypothetical protein